MDQLKASGKPFDISKAEVWDAWIKVKGNQGAAGVDGQSIEDFEKDLRGNLYRIWNRMSSGTYFPPPVRPWRFRKRTVPMVSECLECPQWPTGSRRRWWPRIWRDGWNLCSIPTPTDTGPAARPWTRSESADGAAGSTTG